MAKENQSHDLYDVAQKLKQKLKQWEADFHSTQGRKPGKVRICMV